MKAKFLTNERTMEFTPGLVKFETDNFDFRGSEVKVMCEGVIYNSDVLLSEYKLNTIDELIIKLYTEKGPGAIPNTLHGMYAVMIDDAKTGDVIVINDLYSKRPVYYCFEDGKALVDSSFYGMLDLSKEAGIELSVDMTGLSQMMSDGVFYDYNTYFSQVKFLQYGEYLKIDKDGILTVETYKYEDPYKVDPKASTDELIAHIDMLFRKAAKEAMEKNNKAGYRPAFSLSGGMDSRCSYLAAVPYAKGTPYTFSYGEPNCMDMAIASDLSVLYACDHANFDVNHDFPLDREAVLDRNEGQMVYFGTTGLFRAVSKIKCEDIGLVMTGLAGGEIMGDMCKKSFSEEKNRYVREQVFRTCLNFQFTTRDKFQVFSPYLDEDFYSFLLQLGYETLQHRKLYYAWYLKSFKVDLPVTCVEGKIRQYKSTRVFHGTYAAIKNMKRNLGIRTKWDMNPLLHWFGSNKKVQQFMAENIKNDIDVIKKASNGAELEKTIMDKYNSSNDIIKMYILTATGTLKRYYGR